MAFHFLNYVGSLLRFMLRVLRYRSVESNGRQFLLDYAVAKGGQFSDKLVKEASKRIAIQQLFINDTISLMYGRLTNPAEQHSNRLYFILSSVYDDLMDELGVDLKDLDAMVYHPRQYRSERFYEQALVDTHIQLLDAVRHSDAYAHVIDAIHQAQLDSLNQKGGNLDAPALIDIARRKGGGSLLMCRHYIDFPLHEVLDACWYELGGVIQLSNDLFDVYKDRKEGIDTFVLRSDGIESIRRMYDEQVNRFIDAMKRLNVDQHRKQTCFNVLSLIPALGYVALRQLASVCDEQGKIPDPATLERRLLITDMEKWSNRTYWVTTSYRLSKALKN